MFVNSWRLWAPNLTSHWSLSLFFLFFLFFLSFLLFFLSLFFFLLSSDSVFFLFCSSPIGHSHVNPRRPKPRDHRRRSSITRRKAPPRSHSPHRCYRRHPQLSSDLAGASKSASTATIWPKHRNQHPQQRFNLEAHSSIWKLCWQR